MNKHSFIKTMAKKVDKTAKKKKILEAAILVLAKRGAANTKIQNIAEEAGIAKGTIYLYFKNKEEIFKDILHLHIGNNKQDLHQILKTPGDPKTKLKTLLLSMVESIQSQEYPLGFRFEVLAALFRSPLQKEFSQSITRSQMAITSLLIQMQLEDVNKTKAFELAGGIISLLHGTILLTAMEPEKFNMENIIGTTIDQLIN